MDEIKVKKRDETVLEKENEKKESDYQTPSKLELLKRFHPGQVFFLREGFLKVRKVTNKDVLLRPLNEDEVRKIMKDMEKQKKKLDKQKDNEENSDRISKKALK